MSVLNMLMLKSFSTIVYRHSMFLNSLRQCYANISKIPKSSYVPFPKRQTFKRPNASKTSSKRKPRNSSWAYPHLANMLKRVCLYSNTTSADQRLKSTLYFSINLSNSRRLALHIRIAFISWVFAESRIKSVDVTLHVSHSRGSDSIDKGDIWALHIAPSLAHGQMCHNCFS